MFCMRTRGSMQQPPLHLPRTLSGNLINAEAAKRLSTLLADLLADLPRDPDVALDLAGRRFALAPAPLAFSSALVRGFVEPTQPCVEPRLTVRRVLAPVAALAVESPRALPSDVVHA